MRYRTALLTSVQVLILGLFGCGGGSGSGPTGPAEGTLEVIASTTGSDLDPDGYSLTVDHNSTQPLGPNAADTVASLTVGTHSVTLAGVASNCVLGGENPRTVDVAAGGMARLRFEIACSQMAPTTGAIQVSAATTGDDLNPDDYQVTLDGGSPQPLLINGSVLIAGLTPGDHAVALSDVADNCELSGTNPLTVTVVSGATANVHFSVTCSPLPLAAPGRDIAYTASTGSGNLDVYLLSADGTTLTNLTNSPSSENGPAWSPDGSKIAFSSTFWSNRTASTHIYVMNADGSGQTQLTTGAFAFGPAWSPDGSKIAFFMSTDGTTERIYVMNPDGSAVAQLSTGDANSPAWSPDGSKIAFTGGGSFETDIYIMNADGSDVIRLTAEAGIDAAPSWSPDGTKIYFASDRNGGDRLTYVMNPDGTGVTQLTFGTSSNIYPVWSPDGSKIGFVLGNAETARIYMMNPDGTEQVPLTPSATLISRPAWRP